MKKGKVIWRSQNDVTFCKWKDKRDVLTISKAYVPEMVKGTNCHGKKKENQTLSETTVSQCQVFIVVTRCYPVTQVFEKP